MIHAAKCRHGLGLSWAVNDHGVDEVGDEEDQSGPLLTRPEEKASEAPGVTKNNCRAPLLRVELLLVWHCVLELLHQGPLVGLVPPGLEGPVGGVEAGDPPVLVEVDVVALVQKVGSEEDDGDELECFDNNSDFLGHHCGTSKFN